MVFPNRMIWVEPTRYEFKLKKKSGIPARIRKRIMMCCFHAHLITRLTSDNGQSLGVFQKKLFMEFLLKKRTLKISENLDAIKCDNLMLLFKAYTIVPSTEFLNYSQISSQCSQCYANPILAIRLLQFGLKNMESRDDSDPHVQECKYNLAIRLVSFMDTLQRGQPNEIIRDCLMHFQDLDPLFIAIKSYAILMDIIDCKNRNTKAILAILQTASKAYHHQLCRFVYGRIMYEGLQQSQVDRNGVRYFSVYMVPNQSNGRDLLSNVRNDPIVIAFANYHLYKYTKNSSYLQKSAALGNELAIRELQQMCP
jgi:hypothetical protein